MKLAQCIRINRVWAMAALLALAAGCATRKPAANYLFFPPPPDEPRIQYLTSFGSEQDLGGQGKFSEFLVGQEKVYRPIVKPYGLAIQSGKVYVCDTQLGSVLIADLIKRRLRQLKPEGQAAMKTPINVAVDTDGTIYVTDTGRSQVLIYNQAGNLVAELGKRGEMQPCGIALAGDRLFVTDLTNQCVRVYNKASRQLLFTVPRDHSDQKGRLAGPTNVAIDPHGRIYVSDTRAFDTKVYDAEGNFVRAIGEHGVTPGQFALPKGIGVDHEGRAYVVDAMAPVVQLFDAEGRLLMFFGQPDSSGDAGLYLPAGLIVDYNNLALFEKYVAPGFKLEYLILLTNQVGPHKVSVFGFVKKA